MNTIVKLFGLTTLFAAVLILYGCAVMPDTAEVYLKNCNGSWEGVECDEFGLRVGWDVPQIPHSGDDTAAKVEFDFSSSSSGIMLTKDSGYLVIKATLDDQSVVTNSFQWIRIGDKIILEDPASVDSWFLQHEGYVEVEVNLGDIQATGVEGSNTLSVEAKYDNTVIDGDAFAWYASGDDCSEFDCETVGIGN